MNWSSHNEAFSSQLCSSGFQFHTQPSVSPLNGHHCPRHMRLRRTLSTPATCLTVECPLLSLHLCPFLSFFLLSSTQSHPAPYVFVCLYPTLPANIVLMCFSASPHPHPPMSPPSVMSEFWWNLASRPGGDDMPDESLNQYPPVFLLSLSFFSLSLIVFPPSPRCEHSTSAPPPAALVQQCPGGTRGPSGS